MVNRISGLANSRSIGFSLEFLPDREHLGSQPSGIISQSRKRIAWRWLEPFLEEHP